MPEYAVNVTIENRPGMADPEGETILRDLVLRASFDSVREVRTARVLRFRVDATDAGDAEERIGRMCSELRIYNPLVSRVTVKADGAAESKVN